MSNEIANAFQEYRHQVAISLIEGNDLRTAYRRADEHVSFSAFEAGWNASRKDAESWRDTAKFNEKCWQEERGVMIDKIQSARDEADSLRKMQGRTEETVIARVCGYTPGQSQVELRLDQRGPLPSWLELGEPVTVARNPA